MSEELQALLRAVHKLMGHALNTRQLARLKPEQIEQATHVILYVAAGLESPSLFALNMGRAAVVATPAEPVE